MRERTQLDEAIGGYTALEKDFSETVELIAMAEEDGDQDMVAEGERALRDLADRTQKKQLESLLSGEADGNDCYLEVNAGAGGPEAQDWAEMLLRMSVRWAEPHGYQVERM